MFAKCTFKYKILKKEKNQISKYIKFIKHLLIFGFSFVVVVLPDCSVLLRLIWADILRLERLLKGLRGVAIVKPANRRTTF